MAELADYLALIRLTPEKHGYMYELAKESYDDIYNNIMSKGKNKIKATFLGGNPVTLEKKDFPTLVKNEYMVSTKADGMRFLLMIGNKSEFDQRHLFFVDRNNDFWILVNNGQELPKLGGIPNCLIDGELLMWGDIVQTEDIIRLTPFKKLKPLMVFSAFDILYGPTDPKFSPIQKALIQPGRLPKNAKNEKVQFELGSSGAFMGPKGGYRWPWKKRYSVLSTMMTHKFSPLTTYNNLETEFRFKMVVSPFISLRTVLKASNPYNYMKTVFTKGLEYQFPEIPGKLGLKTDGLILTPTNTEYLKDSWTFCGNDQFKWKPSNELTVDLRLGKLTNLMIRYENSEKSESVYKAYARRGKKLLHVGYVITETNDKPQSNIVECLWLNDPNNPNLFEYKNDRPDKKLPNAEKTVISVTKAIKDPFSMKALKVVYSVGIEELIRLSKTKKLPVYLKSVLQQLNDSFKLKCVLDRFPTKIFNTKELEVLKNLVVKAQNTPNSELETRFRFSMSHLPYFNCLVSKLRSSDYEQPLPVLKMYGPNGLRKSEVILGDHRIKEEFMTKTEIQRVRFNKNSVMEKANYDISYLDTVLSTETGVNTKKFKPTMFRYQIRYEIDPLPLSPLGKTPSVLWRLDITEYGESKKSWEQAKLNYEINPRSSIEIEYAPGDQENSVWRFYEDNPSPQNLLNVVDIFGLDVINNKPELVKTKLDERIRKIGKLDPDFIVKDYCRLVNWVLQLVYN